MAISAVLFVVVAITVININGIHQEKPIEVNNETIVNISNLERQILSIGELVTLQYNYKNVIQLKDSRQIRGWNIPLTQKTLITTVRGTMKIGIDTSDITIDSSEPNRAISIAVPKAKIISHELYEDTLEVLEESSGLFNPICIEDWATEATAQKQAMEADASESDMFARAQNDAVVILKAFIEGVIPEEYTVNITYK